MLIMAPGSTSLTHFWVNQGSRKDNRLSGALPWASCPLRSSLSDVSWGQTGWVTRNLKPLNDSHSPARARGVYWLVFDGDGPGAYYPGNILPAPNCTRTSKKEKQSGGGNNQTWCLKPRDVHFCLYDWLAANQSKSFLAGIKAVEKVNDVSEGSC